MSPEFLADSDGLRDQVEELEGIEAMARLEPLNLDNHRRLRVRALVPDARNFAQIVSSEFEAAAAACPILFSKFPETGQFYAGAMFGFDPLSSGGSSCRMALIVSTAESPRNARVPESIS